MLKIEHLYVSCLFVFTLLNHYLKEMGILRMIGLNRYGLIQLVLTQAFFYSVPALITGVIFGEAIYLLVSFKLADLLQVQVSHYLSMSSVLTAWAIGIIIPILASLIPIKVALGTELREALDTSRPRVVAVKYSIDRASENNIAWPQVWIGIGLFSLGFACM